MLDGKLILPEATVDDSQDVELISINLIYDYPVHWGKFKTLRDFVQNFMMPCDGLSGTVGFLGH